MKAKQSHYQYSTEGSKQVDEDELTIEEALIELKLRGYEDVTVEANENNGPDLTVK